MKRLCITLILLLALVVPAGASAFDHSHADWSVLLQKHATWISNGTASVVDYDGFKTDQQQLNRYLANLSSVKSGQFDSWSRDQQLAFLINAYNAYTIDLILSRWPEIDSIRDLGSLFSSPWKKEFFTLLGDLRHLDWIEHEVIRGSGRYNEPLIHFAVNCASIGCPALLDEAFIAERIDEQLLDVTRRFLQDRSRNRFNAVNGRLEVSSIFDWYEEDFQKGWRGYESLNGFFRAHAEWLSDEESIRARIRKGNNPIRFLPYDWTLNKKQ